MAPSLELWVELAVTSTKRRRLEDAGRAGSKAEVVVADMQTPRTDPAGSDPAARSDVKARKASPLQGDYGETDVLLTTPVHGFVVERKEMVRVMIQSLRDMGFEKSAESLERESGPGQSNVKLSLVQDVSDLVEDLHRLPARVVQRIAAHGESAQIWCVAFNQQGTRVACTGTDKRVRVFDVGSVAGDVKLSPWASLSGEAATCLAWSPCGRLLAAGDEDGRIYIWDGLGGDKSSPKPSPALVLRNLSKRVVRIWWKPSSRRGCEQVIAGSLDGALVLFEARTGAILACWSGAPVYDFVYSSRKRLIVAACGSCDKTSNMIGSCDPVKAASRSQHRFMRIVSMVLSSDEERLFTTIVGGNIVEWCMRTGLWQASYKGAHHGSAVIRSSLGGFCESLIATGTTDGSICIWEREAGEAGESNEADSGAVEPVLMLGEHTQPVNAVTWSPTDPSVLVSVSDDGQLLVWTGKPGQTED
ncbi:WD repeat-containing protein 26-like [Hondaea fermentalgiana]|uniref:WD repeat-containing protein 26-like n=1 Tax=Hondaea fermentalgiana TaxID=2315210 RepID=A0A2R5G2I0_9STRA|nr:WD repeat-containing protein 26-like [Hondaea fermentalgiana]|eukprot:GBG25226.1 WD repeat-containing protein 26-like [Hondaea fermentalgiana]